MVRHRRAAKLSPVALGVFFPVYVNPLHAIRPVDRQLIVMADVHGFARAEMFRRVAPPGARPSVLVGVRYALCIMWPTPTVAETISASSGLGYTAMRARAFMQLQIVVPAIPIDAVLGQLADAVARLLERSTLAWNPAYR